MEEVQYSGKLAQLVDNGITVRTTSPFTEWSDHQNISREQIKEIQIEDLLPRLPIQLSMKNVVGSIENRRIMVTGAAGSIGSEIVRQLAKFNPASLLLIDQAETPLHDLELELKSAYRELRFKTKVVDVCNQHRMEKIFEKTRPHFLFHAAAYKHVPMMENNVPEAIHNNVLGTRTIADLAVKYGTGKFLMVSTDKAVNPSNVMGCSKRICEIYVQSLNRHVNGGTSGTQFITTRFGNVLGSNGSVIPLFKEQIRRGGPVTVTHPDIIRYFMTIPEACQLVLEAGAMGEGGEIYIFDMGNPVKIDDLAKRMIKLSGAKQVRIEYTGLRQGEKLYEELLNDMENVKPTSHDKIMIANVREYDFKEVTRQVDELITLSLTADDRTIVAKMKEIVPEFQSTNNLFEDIENGS
jgi:FlaA1/EpsC-like NDP-sugar epimerase